MALTSDQVAEEFVAWVRRVCPDITGSYPWAPSGKPQSLPDVVVDFTTIEVALNDPDFQYVQLEQVALRIWRAQATIMVDNSDEHAAASQLRSFADALTADLLEAGNLGGAIEWVASRFQFDLTPPLVEYEDGTRGREMTLQLAVADTIGDS